MCVSLRRVQYIPQQGKQQQIFIFINAQIPIVEKKHNKYYETDYNSKFGVYKKHINKISERNQFEDNKKKTTTKLHSIQKPISANVRTVQRAHKNNNNNRKQPPYQQHNTNKSIYLYTQI